MEKSSIKKNFAYQSIYQILILILPFITSPYVSRVLGAKGLGIYSYSYSIAYYFVLFSMLGMANYGNRTIAQSRENKKKLSQTFFDLLAVHILFSLLSCMVYFIYILRVGDNKLYAIIQYLYVFSGLFDISWFYFGIEKFKMTVTRSVIIRILNVIAVFCFVKNSSDLWIYCLIMALGNLINQVVLWIPLHRYVNFCIPNIYSTKSHVKPLLVLFIPTIAVSLYTYMDKIMLGYLSNKSQLGFYENAEKVINIPMTIVSSFGTVMLPKMSNLVISRKNNISKKYILLSMQFIMYLSFGLSFGLAACATNFAPLFWGENFDFCGILIMGLTITIPFISFANVIRTQYLIPNSRDSEYMISVTLGAVTNVISNLIFIKEYGAVGAVISTIIAEIVVCVVQTIFIKDRLPIYTYLKYVYIDIIMGFPMFVIVYLIGVIYGTNLIVLFIQIFVGLILYGSMGIIYFYKTRNMIVVTAINKIISYFK